VYVRPSALTSGIASATWGFNFIGRARKSYVSGASKISIVTEFE
jgi:hypothetical protein